MDNSGDWIYIVFLVVAAISGLLNTKGKKKHPTEVLGQPGYDMLPEEKSSSEKGFWEVFEEMTAQPQEPASSYSKKHKPKKKKKAQQPEAFLSHELTEPPNPQTGTPLAATFSDNDASFSSEDIEFNNLNEVRKAIIYSEILNRKY